MTSLGSKRNNRSTSHKSDPHSLSWAKLTQHLTSCCLSAPPVFLCWLASFLLLNCQSSFLTANISPFWARYGPGGQKQLFIVLLDQLALTHSKRGKERGNNTIIDITARPLADLKGTPPPPLMLPDLDDYTVIFNVLCSAVSSAQVINTSSFSSICCFNTWVPYQLFSLFPLLFYIHATIIKAGDKIQSTATLNCVRHTGADIGFLRCATTDMKTQQLEWLN